MNRFRVNLHPAFFDPERSNTPDTFETPDTFDEALDKTQKGMRDMLEVGTRRNNESLGTAFVETKEEKEQGPAELEKDLQKQLKQLAKNKKIDFPWTDNLWKCSRPEKRLAISSAKVFQQLLEKGTLQNMINKCKSQQGDVTKDIAEQWKSELGINSKPKDIINFYKSFKEYQNPQSEYQHLKNLMGFFCESNFENANAVRESMQTRSQKISRKERNKEADKLYHQELRQSEYGHTYYEMVDEYGKPRPKDWKKRADFEVIKTRLESSKSSVEKMLTLLGDFNLDGEVNSGDVGYKTGSQVVDVFRRTVAIKNLEDKSFNEHSAVENLAKYASKFGVNMENVGTVDGLYEWMTGENGYDNTRKLQNFLINLPVELGDVLENGKEAGELSLNRMVSAIGLEKKEEEAAKKAAEEKSKEIVSSGEAKLKEVIKDDRERADITQQLLAQLPGMLINKAMGEKNGLAIGAGVPLDQIIKGMSAGFNVGIGTDGKPKFGLFLGWDRKFNISDTTGLRTAVSAGTKLLFVPCLAASTEISKDVNKKNRESSLDAKGEKRITLGGNVTMTGPIFSYGFHAGYENNKQLGIEKQAQNINKVVKSQAKSRVEALKASKDKTKASKDKTKAIKESLKSQFTNATEEEVEKAANNIFSIIEQFKIDEKTTDQNIDTYAQVIADVYSEQWRNAKMAGLADNKRKISGGKVGIQFIAGCVPIGTLVLKFTKYRNARTNETEHSRIARIDAQVNGTGNKLVAKEIGQDQVNQISEILKIYGAKVKLNYKDGDDGKPGRIVIPASLSDGIGINIRVAKKLEDAKCVEFVKDSTGEIISYSFPANAIYRLSQETGGNQRSITLNIGSNKSSADDILISDAEGMKKLEGNNELMGSKRWEYNKDYENKGKIEGNTEFMNNLFTDEVIKGLKTIDSSNRRKFSEFMKTKTQANENFNNMVNTLKDVLGSNKMYELIVTKLTDPKTSDSDKQLIIDRVMAISADTNVHDANGLKTNINHRKDYYKKLRGPNGQEIFDILEKDYRSDIVKNLTNYDSQFKSNLLGATAFYHKNNSAKGLAFTGLGATNVLGGVTESLVNQDAERAKNWLFGSENAPQGNLSKEKSPQERNVLKQSVEKNLPQWAKLDDGNLEKILRGEEIEITLDKSEKKAKVKMDVKYVFYLMGECANESVGIELGDLQVQEQQEVDVYAKGGLRINNGDGDSSVNVPRRDFAAGISFGGKKKEKKKDEEKPEYEDGSNPSDGNLEDKTEPEHEGGPIGGNVSKPSNGDTPDVDNSTDDVWTEGEKKGPDGESDHGNDGDL